MAIEVILFYFGIPLGLLLAVLIGALCVFQKTRKLGKRLSLIFIAILVSAIVISLFADPYREFRANQIIKQANPLIEALEQHKIEKGAYPTTLNELIPKYIEHIPNLSVPCREEGINPDCPFIYQRENGAYLLRFWMHGPPFGYHFLYRPSRKYNDWEQNVEQNVFQLKKKIGNWGWYWKV